MCPRGGRAWVSRGWRWHGCSTLSTLDTCSYVRSQEAAAAGTGLSRRRWVSVCVVEYRAVRVLGYAGHRYKCRPLDYAMRGITHQPPRCRSAGLEPSTAVIHHSPFTIHSPTSIHPATSRPLRLCPSVLTRSVPSSASCLPAMHRLPFVPSLPITGLGPIPAYLRISILALIFSSFSPPTPPARTSKHNGTCGATPALTRR
jgi:hypothetical protein